MLDCALTVPASRLGKRQPFLPLRRDPAESPPTMVAAPGPARLSARHVSHINLSAALVHVRVLRLQAET